MLIKRYEYEIEMNLTVKHDFSVIQYIAESLLGDFFLTTSFEALYDFLPCGNVIHYTLNASQFMATGQSFLLLLLPTVNNNHIHITPCI